MCRMCEGFSLEDVLALDAARIDEYGFVVIGVDDLTVATTTISPGGTRSVSSTRSTIPR